MTTIVPFSPSLTVPGNVPWQSNVTLDGSLYTLTAFWLTYAQRWYIQLTALDGTLVFFRPLIGSGTPAALVTMAWVDGNPASDPALAPPDSPSGIVTVTTGTPLGYAAGATVTFTISGSNPAGYDGTYPSLVTGPSSLSYPLASNPGAVVSVGSLSVDVNLAWPYFQTSTLVFRDAAQQFEVTP